MASPLNWPTTPEARALLAQIAASPPPTRMKPFAFDITREVFSGPLVARLGGMHRRACAEALALNDAGKLSDGDMEAMWSRTEQHVIAEALAAETREAA